MENKILEIAEKHQGKMASVHPEVIVSTIKDAIIEALTYSELSKKTENNREFLQKAYDITALKNEAGGLETYVNWLERNLLVKIEKVNELIIQFGKTQKA
jgi:hypothetical protein